MRLICRRQQGRIYIYMKRMIKWILDERSPTELKDEEIKLIVYPIAQDHVHGRINTNWIHPESRHQCFPRKVKQGTSKIFNNWRGQPIDMERTLPDIQWGYTLEGCTEIWICTRRLHLSEDCKASFIQPDHNDLKYWKQQIEYISYERAGERLMLSLLEICLLK